MAPMLTPSWNAPSLVAPSPMKQTATRFSRFILKARRHARGDGDSPANDGNGGDHALGEIAQMHRSAFALATTGAPAEQLRHRVVDRDSLSQGMAVRAMCAGNRVGRLQGGAHATAQASCPLHWWMVPGITPSRNRYFTRSSKWRINVIRR